MTDNAWMALGLLVIVMVAAWALTRKARCNEQFDEMQLKIRARGFQIGFFTALGLMMVLAFLLGVLITLFCIRKKRNQREDHTESKKEENGGKQP